MLKHEEESKQQHIKHEEESKQQPSGAGAKDASDVPAGWKPDPPVIPGRETDPVGVMSLEQPAPKHSKGEAK
jgi:hypothetical protein